MGESTNDFLQGEYDYLRGREGDEFFFALAPYTSAIHGKRPVRRALKRLKGQVSEARKSHLDEQTEFIEAAKGIRRELAERAPDIDNSAMERSDDPTSQAWLEYDLDSFARFDELADAGGALPGSWGSRRSMRVFGPYPYRGTRAPRGRPILCV